jgi:hypothetical protein
MYINKRGLKSLKVHLNGMKLWTYETLEIKIALHFHHLKKLIEFVLQIL